MARETYLWDAKVFDKLDTQHRPENEINFTVVATNYPMAMRTANERLNYNQKVTSLVRREESVFVAGVPRPATGLSDEERIAERERDLAAALAECKGC